MTVVLTYLFKLLSFPFLFADFYSFIFTLSQLGIIEILQYSALQNGGRLPSSFFYFGCIIVISI